MRLLARFPSDGADEFDLDLRGVLLGVPFTDVDQSGLDELEAVEELQDFFVGPEVYCREPCLLADGSAGLDAGDAFLQGARLCCGLRKGTMVPRRRAGAAAGSRRCSPPFTVPEGERNEQ
jgi:hypothetical protein